MVGGEIATETTAATLAADPELQRRYLGVEPLAQE
jgi:ABC-type branched-subunit amino acid transport system ATPase component